MAAAAFTKLGVSRSAFLGSTAAPKDVMWEKHGVRQAKVSMVFNFYQHSSKHTVSDSKQKRSPILDFDEDEEDDDDSDDEDSEILDMQEWMKNKPTGFGGAGKVYDTSLEDRLLEEIKRDQLAQAADKAASKNKKPIPAVRPAKKQGNDVSPDGVEVFVKNLPRKKNVDRDMRAALRSVLGLLHIRPLVSGNEKTREPVCKGMAFLTFETLDDAEEFVERYNGQLVVFGKVEKKIVCELAKTSSPHKQSSAGQSSNGPRLAVRDPLSRDLSDITPSTIFQSVDDAVAVKVASEEKNSSGSSHPLEVEVREDSLYVDGSLEEDDSDLFVLEQQIWDELENEEDFVMDLELEAEEGSGEASARSHVEEGNNFSVCDPADVRHEAVEDDHRPQVSGQGLGRSTISVESRDDARAATKNCVGSLDEKEKRIRELEGKLDELQSQLNKRNLHEFSSSKDPEVSVREQERKIESLEKRLLSRAKAGKETNVSNGKPTSSTGKPVAVKGRKNTNSTSEKTSKDRKPKSPPQLKLGASSRLKRREREIFTETLSKYSARSSD